MNPDTFETELHTRIGRNFRLRRSLDGRRWRIEQKVARVYDYPATDDRTLMLKEGYHLVLDTPLTDTTRCPDCDTLLSLPLFERAEFSCPKCQAGGSRRRLVDGYFPLVDRTLLYLERIHPRRGNAWSKELDEQNRQRKLSAQRDTRNFAEDLASDAWNRVRGAVSVGRTGRNTPHAWGGAYGAPWER